MWWNPLDFLRLGDRRTQLRVLGVWGALSAICVAIAPTCFDWEPFVLQAGDARIALSVYPPLVIFALLTLWVGPYWGVIPAYFASLCLSHFHGMPWTVSALFSLATPLTLAVLWASLAM